ncbi:MAG: universal stress protein [Chitinophagaceae bacterium]|nr:universal stress protein [Chitinophagaceae bacterium]
MQKLFTKILVPVNFSRGARWALDKAVQLANKFDCDIHLVNVQSQTPAICYFPNIFFPDYFNRSVSGEMKAKMKDLEKLYSPKLKSGLLITSASQTGYWQSVLKDIIIAEHIDLVIIPRSHKRLGSSLLRRININKLAQETGCPVMTVTRNFNANHLQNIVVPVFDLLPVRKLTMATYLSFETSACIYLMGKDDFASDRSGSGYLFRAYQLLNEYGRINIRCSLQDNEDTAGSTLSYAKNVKANLIVVNPGKESRLKGWWNKLRGKYLCNESEIPVRPWLCKN